MYWVARIWNLSIAKTLNIPVFIVKSLQHIIAGDPNMSLCHIGVLANLLKCFNSCIQSPWIIMICCNLCPEELHLVYRLSRSRSPYLMLIVEWWSTSSFANTIIIYYLVKTVFSHVDITHYCGDSKYSAPKPHFPAAM